MSCSSRCLRFASALRCFFDDKVVGSGSGSGSGGRELTCENGEFVTSLVAELDLDLDLVADLDFVAGAGVVCETSMEFAGGGSVEAVVAREPHTTTGFVLLSSTDPGPTKVRLIVMELASSFR